MLSRTAANACVRGGSSCPKIEKLDRLYLQCVADIENHVERNGAVRRFDPAHVRAADVHALGQLALRKTAVLAVIGDIQPETPVFGKLIVSHALTLIQSTRRRHALRQRKKIYL